MQISFKYCKTLCSHREMFVSTPLHSIPILCSFYRKKKDKNPFYFFVWYELSCYGNNLRMIQTFVFLFFLVNLIESGSSTFNKKRINKLPNNKQTNIDKIYIQIC